MALSVWMYGLKVAAIEQPRRGKLRLTYTGEALAAYPPGTPLLSVALPLTREPFGNAVVTAFLDGLLPEGAQREAIAAQLDVLASDTYALTRALGRDSAGALVMVADDQPPPAASTTLAGVPLEEAELEALVANLRNAPLGVRAGVRLSLAGVQDKLVLTRMPDGFWARPTEDAPSTHILKPELAAFPGTVENEAFCMRVAARLGLPAARVETTTVRARTLLVVERYDRVVHADGSVDRVHQEDFCQALSLQVRAKYEHDGGPSLRRIAGVLDAVAAAPSLDLLLRAVTLNVLLGNGDAHGKNFSLLHGQDGSLRLAPLYDIVSTLAYNMDLLAMHIDSVRRLDNVTADRIIREAVSWGLSRRAATQAVGELLDLVPAAVGAATRETDGLSDRVLEVVEQQRARLTESLPDSSAR